MLIKSKGDLASSEYFDILICVGNLVAPHKGSPKSNEISEQL